MKERIVKGAEDLFLSYGVKIITMDEIARNLGISKKTIYQYYKDKNELVCEVINNHLKEREKSYRQIADIAVDPIHELIKLTEYVRDSFRNINPIILFEVERYFPKAFQNWVDHKEKCLKVYIIDILNRGKEQGLFRMEINVEMLSRLRIEEIQLGFNIAVFPPMQFSIQELQIQFIDYFLHGICTLKGHKLINKYKNIQDDD